MQYRPSLYNFNKTHRFGIIIPGLLLAFNRTILEFANKFSRDYLKSPIPVSITTWDDRENNKWIRQIENLQSNYIHLNIKVHTQSYTSKEFKSYIQKFYTKLGINATANYVPSNVFKLLAVSYIHHKASENAYQDFKNEDSFSTWTSVITKSMNEFTVCDSNIENLYKFLKDEFLLDRYLPKQSIARLNSPYEPITVSHGSSESLELDSMLVGTSTYRQLMGLSIDDLVDTLYYSFTKLYPSFEKRLKGKVDLPKDFVYLINYSGEGPLEGPFVFMNFLKRNIPDNLIIYDTRFLSRLIIRHPHYRSPNMDFVNGILSRDDSSVLEKVEKRYIDQLILKKYE